MSPINKSSKLVSTKKKIYTKNVPEIKSYHNKRKTSILAIEKSHSSMKNLTNNISLFLNSTIVEIRKRLLKLNKHHDQISLHHGHLVKVADKLKDISEDFNVENNKYNSVCINQSKRDILKSTHILENIIETLETQLNELPKSKDINLLK